MLIIHVGSSRRLVKLYMNAWLSINICMIEYSGHFHCAWTSSHSAPKWKTSFFSYQSLLENVLALLSLPGVRNLVEVEDWLQNPHQLHFGKMLNFVIYWGFYLGLLLKLAKALSDYQKHFWQRLVKRFRSALK